MTAALLIFASSFFTVFALGIQSLNVHGGHKVMAAITSFVIGMSNLVTLKLMPGSTDGWQIAAYLLGGPLGIVSGMTIQPRLVRLFKRS